MPTADAIRETREYLIAQAREAALRAEAAVREAGAEGRQLATRLADAGASLVIAAAAGRVSDDDVRLATQALRDGVEALGWWSIGRADRIAAREAVTALRIVLGALVRLAAAV